MKKIIRNIRLFVARTKILEVQEAIKLNLMLSSNIYGDEINKVNARSWWIDEKGNFYRVKQLITPKQKYNIRNKKTHETIYNAWIEPYQWVFAKTEIDYHGFTHKTQVYTLPFFEYELHPLYLVKNLN